MVNIAVCLQVGSRTTAQCDNFSSCIYLSWKRKWPNVWWVLLVDKKGQGWTFISCYQTVWLYYNCINHFKLLNAVQKLNGFLLYFRSKAIQEWQNEEIWKSASTSCIQGASSIQAVLAPKARDADDSIESCKPI